MLLEFTDLSEARQTRFSSVRVYVENFLTRTHPGRKGAICPFVGPALERGLIRYNVVSGSGNQIVMSGVKQTLCHHKKKPGGASIVLFDEDTPFRIMRRVTKELRVEAFLAGYMLACFEPENNGCSLHDDNFFPFRTPVPMVVIRDIHMTDFKFYKWFGMRRAERVAFLKGCLAKFADQPQLADEVRRMLDEAQKPIWKFW